MFGIDYAWGTPDFDALDKAGVKFICRYLSTPGNSKNLRKEEVVAARRRGMKIVTVFETTAGRALAGRAAGSTDASEAKAQLEALGAPKNAPVYFAVDFDATEAQQAAINGYLRGAADVLGKDRVGIYGGLWPCRRALDAGVCKYMWQTYAWSGGVLEKRANLYQYSNGHVLGGVSCDYDKSLTADFGQWKFGFNVFSFALVVGSQVVKHTVWFRKSKLAAKYKKFHANTKDRVRESVIKGKRVKILRRKKHKDG